mmetsp:Transcript_79858/g.178905  ORF Transcript_79858/g.178905 Transcript_79858/m.178905 type:complete len:332 (+) Transcript_79858:119-1114(+)
MQLPPEASAAPVLGNFSDSAGSARLYGALMDQRAEGRAAAAMLLKRRRRVNCVPLLLALFCPWAVFLAVYALTSFYVHYAAPLTTALAATAALMASASLAASALLGKEEGQFFPLYMGFALTVAVVGGWALGDFNFWSFMQPSYEEAHLATYTNVDPSSERLWSGEVVPTRGAQYQDAGKVYFRHEVVLDRNRSMSFKNGELYCVAPIVNPKCRKNCGLDFWAVGVNCCSEEPGGFRCGEYDNPHALSGLRSLVESQRPLFRLAVLQAAGAHGVVIGHPLFFHWVQDPIAEIHLWQKGGWRRFIEVMFVSFLANAAVLALVLSSNKAVFRR